MALIFGGTSFTHQKEDKCNAAVYEHRIITNSLKDNANQNAYIDNGKFVAGK